MDRKWGLDEVEHIPQLFAIGQQRASETFDWVKETFLHHQRNQFVPFESDAGAYKLDEFGFD